MRLLPYEWEELAITEAEAATSFFATHYGNSTSDNFLNDLFASIESIRGLASLDSGPEMRAHHLNLKKFPYFIGYTRKSNRIWILTVTHGHVEDPEHWFHRVDELG